MSLLFNDYYKRFSLGSAFYFNVLLKGENTAIHIYTIHIDMVTHLHTRFLRQ